MCFHYKTVNEFFSLADAQEEKAGGDTGEKLTPESPSSRITAKVLPENAGYGDLVWSVVTNSGIPTNTAAVSAEGNAALLTALGDGAFRLCCSCANGKPQSEVVSEYEFTAEGFGQSCFDPYEFLPQQSV